MSSKLRKLIIVSAVLMMTIFVSNPAWASETVVSEQKIPYVDELEPMYVPSDGVLLDEVYSNVDDIKETLHFSWPLSDPPPTGCEIEVNNNGTNNFTLTIAGDGPFGGMNTIEQVVVHPGDQHVFFISGELFGIAAMSNTMVYATLYIQCSPSSSTEVISADVKAIYHP